MITVRRILDQLGHATADDWMAGLLCVAIVGAMIFAL